MGVIGGILIGTLSGMFIPLSDPIFLDMPLNRLILIVVIYVFLPPFGIPHVYSYCRRQNGNWMIKVHSKFDLLYCGVGGWLALAGVILVRLEFHDLGHGYDFVITAFAGALGMFIAAFEEQRRGKIKNIDVRSWLKPAVTETPV